MPFYYCCVIFFFGNNEIASLVASFVATGKRRESKTLVKLPNVSSERLVAGLPCDPDLSECRIKGCATHLPFSAPIPPGNEFPVGLKTEKALCEQRAFDSS